METCSRAHGLHFRSACHCACSKALKPTHGSTQEIATIWLSRSSKERPPCSRVAATCERHQPRSARHERGHVKNIGSWCLFAAGRVPQEAQSQTGRLERQLCGCSIVAAGCSCLQSRSRRSSWVCWVPPYSVPLRRRLLTTYTCDIAPVRRKMRGAGSRRRELPKRRLTGKSWRLHALPRMTGQSMARWVRELHAGGNPFEDELQIFAAFLGGSTIARPPGRVRVHTFARVRYDADQDGGADAAGHRSGHYVPTQVLAHHPDLRTLSSSSLSSPSPSCQSCASPTTTKRSQRQQA